MGELSASDKAGLTKRLPDKPKWCAVFGKTSGWALDVHDHEVKACRKSLTQQKLRFVEGFATPDEALAEVHRQLARLCKRPPFAVSPGAVAASRLKRANKHDP
jgi:hypothetical protein